MPTSKQRASVSLPPVQRASVSATSKSRPKRDSLYSNFLPNIVGRASLVQSDVRISTPNKEATQRQPFFISPINSNDTVDPSRDDAISRPSWLSFQNQRVSKVVSTRESKTSQALSASAVLPAGRITLPVIRQDRRQTLSLSTEALAYLRRKSKYLPLKYSHAEAGLSLSKQRLAQQRWHLAVSQVIKYLRATKAMQNLGVVSSIGVKQIGPSRSAANAHTNSLMMRSIGFNAANFKVENKFGATTRSFEALMKEPAHRTDEEVEILQVLALSLPGLEKYSKNLRRQLGRIMYFGKFEAGRTILKQGHVAQNFYYVLSGLLSVFIQRNAEAKPVEVKTLLRGDMFGELALIAHNKSRRSATVIATTDVELLWFIRDDFEAIFKSETIRELDERVRYISETPFFAGMGVNAMRELALTAQMHDVRPETCILAEGDTPKFVYLLCEGECKVLKVLNFAKVAHPEGRFSLHPFPLPSNIPDPLGHTKVPKLAKLETMEAPNTVGLPNAVLTSGSPPQIAVLGQLIALRTAAQMSFSLVAHSQVRFMKINRNTLCKEIAAFAGMLEEIASRHTALETRYSGLRQMQISYLAWKRWERYKRDSVRDFVEASQRGKEAKRRQNLLLPADSE